MAPRRPQGSRRHRPPRRARQHSIVDRPEFITETSTGIGGSSDASESGSRESVDRRWPAALAGIVVVGIVLWSIASSSPDDQAGGRPAPDLVEPAVPYTPRPFVGVEAGDGPILGRPVDYLLMVGGAQPLRTFDLTTGDLIGIDRIIEPGFVAGNWLIFRDSASDWFWESLDGAVAARAFDPAGPGAEVVPDDASSVWLSWSNDDGGRQWQLIDLESGDVERETSTSTDAKVPGAPCCTFVGPEVIGSRGGGVFALDDDDVHRRVLDGDLIAAGDDRVLVRQCDDQLRCESVWFEIGTWDRLDLPLPAGEVRSGRFVAGGSLLAGSEPRAALGSGLYEVETGRSLRSLGSTPIHDALVSPDGEWMLRRLYGRVEVVDVATGASVTVPGLEVGSIEGIAWVPRPAPPGD
jgi:hypothetical protein